MSTMENDIDEGIETVPPTNNEGNEDLIVAIELVDGNSSYESGDGVKQAVVVNQLIPVPKPVQQEKPKEVVPCEKRKRVGSIS